MVLMIILLIRTDLISRWQTKLPDKAPNHFVINIQPYEVNGLKQVLLDNKITTENIYPMVRGRISQINDIPVMQALSEEAQQDPSLKRELNLSWTQQLQENNKITQGRWWTTDNKHQAVISIEQGLADRLGIQLFDRLSFQIADREITAQVISLRSVQWDSFQPNFFIQFPEGVLETYPTQLYHQFLFTCR